MATILFPTSDGRRTALGEPARAKPCGCPVSWTDDGEECVRCGHWTEAAIRATWALQARKMASGADRRREAVAA